MPNSGPTKRGCKTLKRKHISQPNRFLPKNSASFDQEQFLEAIRR